MPPRSTSSSCSNSSCSNSNSSYNSKWLPLSSSKWASTRWPVAHLFSSSSNHSSSSRPICHLCSRWAVLSSNRLNSSSLMTCRLPISSICRIPCTSNRYSHRLWTSTLHRPWEVWERRTGRPSTQLPWDKILRCTNRPTTSSNTDYYL